MILLGTSGTGDQLTIASGGVSADLECVVAYVDNNAGAITPGRTVTASITGSGATVICAGPGAGWRAVKHINVVNNHASQVATPTIYITNSVDGTIHLFESTLSPGETIIYGEDGSWKHYTRDGIPVGFETFATQSDMESIISETKVVPPGRMHQHPGTVKFWCKANAAGAASVSYNVTSIGDTGTGRMTVTIATDFSSANWCCIVSAERASTALGDAVICHAHIRSAGQAAGTIEVNAVDAAADNTTAVVLDPTTWHVMGLGDQ